MIESVGYTEDGQVWMRLVMEIHGEKMTGTLMIHPDLARAISKNLIDAAEGAEAREYGVRKRSNIN